MDDKEDILKVVRAIHDTSTGSVVAVAGAGASALEWLLGTTGSSRTILEALAPNSPKAMADFIGYMPEQFVSDQTALNMAAAAYRRGAQLREDEGVPVVGIGCTATVATDRPKRGEHRCHIAAWWPTGASSSYLELTKGLRDRSGEDDLVSRLLLRVLAKTSGVDDPVALPLAAGEQVVEDGWSFTDVLSATVAGHVRTAVVPPDGAAVADQPIVHAILSGSFNPLHDGHRELARVAKDVLDSPVAFELSITNVDKPALEESEVRNRLRQFTGYGPVVITHAPVFVQKARLLPGCTFVIGADTALRLVEARYYGDRSDRMLDALAEMRLLRCRFLVAGRQVAGQYRTLEETSVPSGFEDMFTSIPESCFRQDVSSTELRQTSHPGGR